MVLREELVVGGSDPVRQSTELAIGVAFRTLRSLLGPEWRPRRVCFAHDPPADRSVHERVFGRNVEFGHDFNGIVCARSDLEVPNPNADPHMARLARQLLEASPTNRPRDMSTQVRELVVMLLGSGTCTIDRVAQHLGVDRRKGRARDFRLVGELLSFESYGIAYPRGDPAFADVVERTFRTLAESREIAWIYDRWFVRPLPGGISVGMPMSVQLRRSLELFGLPPD